MVLAWILHDVVVGRGFWSGVGGYLNKLTSRAGPTRDLRQKLGLASGPGADRPVKLRVWDWWSPSANEAYGEYFSELERIFEEENPEVDVIFQPVPFSGYEQKLATAMLGDRPPDVFQCSAIWAQGFYKRGMLLKLNDFLAGSEAEGIQAKEFIASTLRHSRTGNDIYGVPHIADAFCLMWNLDILEAEARANPELLKMFERNPDGKVDFSRLRYDAVKSWDEFRRITKMLTKDVQKNGQTIRQYGFEIAGYGESLGFVPWAVSNGAQFQDEAGTRALFDSPESVEALNFILTLYHIDKVSPPFRLAMAPFERFQRGNIACSRAGTWSGKSIIRNTGGWKHFAMTAFPPGPRGKGPKTLVWGNMMVIGSRSKHPKIAFKYLKLVCSRRGALLRLKLLEMSSPRKDLYTHPDWKATVAKYPDLSNIPSICNVGEPLYHTQVAAVTDEVKPIIEYLMLNWPEVRAGKGIYRDSAHALADAAARVNEVYRRYGKIVRDWDAARARREGR